MKVSRAKEFGLVARSSIFRATDHAHQGIHWQVTLLHVRTSTKVLHKEQKIWSDQGLGTAHTCDCKIERAVVLDQVNARIKHSLDPSCGKAVRESEAGT